MRFLDCHGYRVLLHHMDGEMVTVRAIVNAGAYHNHRCACAAPGVCDPDGEPHNEGSEFTPGSAHFLEHMFFKGTKRRSYKDMHREVASIGDQNAYTSADRTVFHMDTVGTSVKRALALLLELFFEPNPTEEEFEKERGVIQQELQSILDSPVPYFIQNAEQAVFKTDLGLSTPIGGTIESVARCTLEEMLAFHERFYTKQNVMFALVGDLTHISDRDVFAAFKKYESALPVGKREVITPAEPAYGTWELPVLHSFEHTSDQVAFGLWTPGMTSFERHAGGYVDLVLDDLLGGGLHGLLMDRLREELGLCYATGYFSTSVWGQAYRLAYALVKPDSVDQAVKEMQKVLQAVAQGDFPEETVEACVGHTEYNVALPTTTPWGMARHYVDVWFSKEHLFAQGGGADVLLDTPQRALNDLRSRWADGRGRDEMNRALVAAAERTLRGSFLCVMNAPADSMWCSK